MIERTEPRHFPKWTEPATFSAA